MSHSTLPARPPAQFAQSDTVGRVVVALVFAVAPFIALVALTYATLTAGFLVGVAVAALYPTLRIRLRRLRGMIARSRTARVGLSAVGLRR
ncbi:hypothetical protein ACKVMT_13720 [Halobacteriales archaeon Cl-PHB]